MFVGGFKIQLLDSKGRHVQDLTPPGEFVGDQNIRETVKCFLNNLVHKWKHLIIKSNKI